MMTSHNMMTSHTMVQAPDVLAHAASAGMADLDGDVMAMMGGGMSMAELVAKRKAAQGK